MSSEKAASLLVAAAARTARTQWLLHYRYCSSNLSPLLTLRCSFTRRTGSAGPVLPGTACDQLLSDCRDAAGCTVSSPGYPGLPPHR